MLSAPPILGTVDALCEIFPATTPSQTKTLETEFFDDHTLLSSLEKSMQHKRGRAVNWQEWHRFLYGAIRIMHPQVVFETGVLDGRSSAVILAAMARNQTGELVSIGRKMGFRPVIGTRLAAQRCRISGRARKKGGTQSFKVTRTAGIADQVGNG